MWNCGNIENTLKIKVLIKSILFDKYLHNGSSDVNKTTTTKKTTTTFFGCDSIDFNLICFYLMACIMTSEIVKIHYLSPSDPCPFSKLQVCCSKAKAKRYGVKDKTPPIMPDIFRSAMTTWSSSPSSAVLSSPYLGWEPERPMLVLIGMKDLFVVKLQS